MCFPLIHESGEKKNDLIRFNLLTQKQKKSSCGGVLAKDQS